eukprot:gene7321-8139_t
MAQITSETGHRPRLLHSIIQDILEIDAPRGPCLIYNDGRNDQECMLYDELVRLIIEGSKELQIHCKSNQYIGIDAANTTIETIVALLSLINIKAIICPLNISEEPKESIKLCKKLNIAAILVKNTNFNGLSVTDLATTTEEQWFVSGLSAFKGEMSLVKREFAPEDNLNPSFVDFVMQSSGSTGPSKLIQVPSQCIHPNILDLCSSFNINKNDTIFLSSPLTFDASIVQIFASLLRRASVLIVSDVIKKQPSKLYNALFERNKTTILQATPSLVQQIGQTLLSIDKTFSDTSLRVLCLGAEAFPLIETIKRMVGKDSSIDLYNIYGISEVSSWASLEKVDLRLFQGKLTRVDSLMLNPDDEDIIECFCKHNVSIGEPLSGTKIELRSIHGQCIHRGIGEIWIGGKDRVCLVGDETSLVQNTMRFSGDIGLIKDNKIYYLERYDNRIKIFGKFVDLEIIEDIAEEIAAVDSSVCVQTKSNGNLPQESYLTLFVSRRIVDDEEIVIEEEIWTRLKARLPAHCMPSRINFLDEMPLTSHGKKDRRLLQTFAHSLSEKTVSAKPDDTLENSVLNIFESVLQNGSYASMKSSNGKSFIENGGNSFMAVFVENKLRTLLKDDLYDKKPLLFDYILSKDLESLLVYMNNGINRKRKSHNVNASSLSSSNEKQLNSSVSYSIETGDCSCYVSKGNRSKTCDMCLQNISNLTKNKHSKNEVSNFKLEILWRTDTFKCIDASPLITSSYDEKLCVAYIGSHSHFFSAIETLTGNVLWRVKLGDRIESSAALSKDGKKLIVGCYDKIIYIIDRQNGMILWKFKTGDCVKSSAIVSPETGIAYIGSHDQYLYALDVDTYMELWKVHCGGGSCFSSPVLNQDNSKVFIATLAGNVVAVALSNGEIIWKFSTNKPIFSSPCITNNSILCFGCVDEYIYGLNMNGTLLWKVKTEKPIFSSPLFVDSLLPNMESVVVIGCHDCFVYCVSCNGFLIWSLKIDSPVYSTPSLVKVMTRDNSALEPRDIQKYCVVVCSTQGNIYIIDLNTGKILTRDRLSGEIFSSPVVSGNRIFVGCRDDYLYCLQLL